MKPSKEYIIGKIAAFVVLIMISAFSITGILFAIKLAIGLF